MNIAGIIPARYGSTRFPGKPLAFLGNQTIIQHVYKRSQEALRHVFVATDDQRIHDTVLGFGGKSIMTSIAHRSGTDRCAEALMRIEMETDLRFDAVINIQGDEPFIHPEQIRQLSDLFEDREAQITTLIKRITDPSDIFEPNKPKVVVDMKGFALFFSRSPIPYIRGLKQDKWPGETSFYKHIGIYGYRREVLLAITRLEASELEIAESLEQLRWLSNAYKIKTAETIHESIGIDTPEDLEAAIKRYTLEP